MTGCKHGACVGWDKLAQLVSLVRHAQASAGPPTSLEQEARLDSSAASCKRNDVGENRYSVAAISYIMLCVKNYYSLPTHSIMKRFFIATCQLTAFILGGLSVLCGTASCDDWPQWRGSQRDGIWHEKGIRTDLPEGQLPWTWSAEIDRAIRSHRRQGRVYVMDRKADDRIRSNVCFALIPRTANSSGVMSTTRLQSGYPAGPRAIVTIDQGLAYASDRWAFPLPQCGGRQCDLKRDLQTEYEIEMPIWGISASPLIYRNLVIQQVADPKMLAWWLSTRAMGKRCGERCRSSRLFISDCHQLKPIKTCCMLDGDSLSGLNPIQEG